MLENKILAPQEILEKYQLQSNTDLFMVELNKVIEERCDELDNEIDDAGYEIIHREYIRVATSIYDYLVFFK